MAAYPCSFTGHRYPGFQRSVYISRVAGARPTTLKHRLCAQHLQVVGAVLDAEMIFMDPEADGLQMSMVCEDAQCAEPRSETVFVKVFGEDGERPQEWSADLCSAHAEALLTALSWSSAVKVGS